MKTSVNAEKSTGLRTHHHSEARNLISVRANVIMNLLMIAA